MDRLECAKCRTTLVTEGPCPKCGSSERILLEDLLARPDFCEGFSMLIVAPMQIWTYLPAAIRSNLKELATSHSHSEVKGLCLQVIVSTASLVEGLVSDYVEQEIESLLATGDMRTNWQKILEVVEYTSWEKKRMVIRDHIGWQIENLESFGVTDLLFKLRNQLGHAKSYKLMDRRHIIESKLKRDGSIRLGNRKYAVIYEELSSRGILPPIEEHCDINVEMFLVPDVATNFYEHAVKFLRAFVEGIQLSSRIDMTELLEASLK